MTDLFKHAGILCAGGFQGGPVNVSGIVKGWKTNVKTFLSVLSAGLKSACEFTGERIFLYVVQYQQNLFSCIAGGN